MFIEEANWRDVSHLRSFQRPAGDSSAEACATASSSERSAKADRKGRVEHFYELPFRIGPFRVSPFALPHPGEVRWNSWGFRVEAGGAPLAYATDLGHVPPHIVAAMS